VEYQFSVSNLGTVASTCGIADMDNVVNQLEREIYIITLNQHMQCKQEFSIRLSEFEAWWHAFSVQELQKTIEQHVLHFATHCYIFWAIYPSQFGKWVLTIFSPQLFSEMLHICNVTEAYCSTNNVNYIRQMIKYSYQCIGLDYLEEILSYLALQGWYDIDSASAFNLLSAAGR